MKHTCLIFHSMVREVYSWTMTSEFILWRDCCVSYGKMETGNSRAISGESDWENKLCKNNLY